MLLQWIPTFNVQKMFPLAQFIFEILLIHDFQQIWVCPGGPD